MVSGTDGGIAYDEDGNTGGIQQQRRGKPVD